jgi:hypothetical protein
VESGRAIDVSRSARHTVIVRAGGGVNTRAL